MYTLCTGKVNNEIYVAKLCKHYDLNIALKWKIILCQQLYYIVTTRTVRWLWK